MAPPFLTLKPSTSPLNLSPHPSPNSDGGNDSDYTDKVSPLTPSPIQHNDLSRISGFPQASGFNFGLSISGNASPTSPSMRRRSSDSSEANLIPNRPQGSNSPPGVAPGESHVGIVASGPAPPPYEKYNQYSVAVGGVHASRSTITAHQFPTNPSIPAPSHLRGHGRLSSAPSVHTAPRRFSGQRQVYPLTLGDMRSGQREISGNNPPKASWRIFGDEEGLDSPNEKRTLSKKGKMIIYVVAATVLIAVAIIGILIGTMKPKAQNTNTTPAFNISGFPELPTGMAVIRPQGLPEKPSSSCVEPQTLWSCNLPADSIFPTNTSRSDGNGLPEFIFTIALRNSTKGDELEDSLWEPVPALVPGDADYLALAATDGIVSDNKIGEETQFYLSMQTEQTKPITISSEGAVHRRHRKRQTAGTPAQMLPSKLRNQQLRLFDRGLDTEHYGFFVHYKKTINVLAALPSEVTDYSKASDSPSGVGASMSGAKEIIWENTRFKVVIWTKQRAIGAMDLIGEGDIRHSSREGAFDDFFPYPVSIIEDRAGDKGQVYYGPNFQEKTVVEELDSDSKGCFCEWRNWRQGVN